MINDDGEIIRKSLLDGKEECLERRATAIPRQGQAVRGRSSKFCLLESVCMDGLLPFVIIDDD